MASSSALSTSPPGPGPGCGDNCSQTATRREVPDHRRRDWLGCLHHVTQDAVDHVLLKNSEVAVCQQVHLVGFQLQAEFIGKVAQTELSKIGHAGFRAHRGELRGIDLDLVIRILIRPGFDFGQFRIDTEIETWPNQYADYEI